MKGHYEITIEMELNDIKEAIYEYLDKRGVNCSGSPLEFIMTKEEDEGIDLNCKITGARKIHA